MRHWKAGEGSPDAATVRATVERALTVAPRGWAEMTGAIGSPAARGAGPAVAAATRKGTSGWRSAAVGWRRREWGKSSVGRAGDGSGTASRAKGSSQRIVFMGRTDLDPGRGCAGEAGRRGSGAHPGVGRFGISGVVGAVAERPDHSRV